SDGLASGFKSRDVKSRMRERDDFMPGQTRLQRAPELPARAHDQYFHSDSSGNTHVVTPIFVTTWRVPLQTTAKRPSTGAAVSPLCLSSTGSASRGLRTAS